MTFTARLHTTTLDAHPRQASVKKILSTALEAADPAQAVRSTLKLEKGLLKIREQSFPLEDISRLYLVAIGKAASAMASAASEILSDPLSGGIVVSKYPTENNLDHLSLHLAGHPVPNEHSSAAGEAILELLSQTNENDFLLFLISGGGSALITAPVDGVSLADLQKLTALLLSSGARIDEINILRRALDRVKGGGLAQAAYPAQFASLLLSDVVDSPLETIASGPTVPNPTTNADALAILEKYDLLKQIPPPILAALKKTQKDAAKKDISTQNTYIIGSNRISAEAAKERAIQEGFKAHILTTSLQGEAAEKGNELALHLLTAKEQPLCLIVGGETTVSLGDSNGHGGRNQEMALAAVETLSGRENIMFITLATDGDDGPTDAAGAVVTGETFARAKELGLDLETHLREHNAYPLFNALGDLLKPGPTGTNVNDLIFLFSF